MKPPTGVTGRGASAYAVTPADLASAGAASVDVFLAPAETAWTDAERDLILKFAASGKGIVFAGARADGWQTR